MKAAVLYAKKDLRVTEVKKPIIGEGEVLIRVRASGVCGSDLPRVLGTESRYYPNILGHEFSGVVEECSPDARNIKVGDKVSVAPLVPCHVCENCLSGHYSLCKNYSFIGSRQAGAWAEYIKVPEINVVKLADELDFIEGAFLEPLTVALHGLLLMDFKPLSTVAITGMGTIGLLTLQCAKIMGAKEITVFDIDDEKLKIAKKLGADYVVNTRTDDIYERIKNIAKGKGFEMVIETAGVPFTELLCLNIAGNNAHVMFIGTPHKAFTIEQAQFENINRKELKVQGSWMSYSAPFPGREWKLGVDYLANAQVKVRDLIDRIISLDEIVDTFADFESGKVSGKVVLKL